MDGKYSKVLTALLIIAIIVILAILGALGGKIVYDNIKKADAESGADAFMENVISGNKNNNKNKNNNNVNESLTNAVDPVLGIDSLLANNTNTIGQNGSSKKQTYKGFPMVGTIEIPRTKLKCPVLESASKAAIEVAVGIYDGPGLNKIGNTIIAGHNYRNGTFFSDNKKIEIGDKIYITDESGTKITYIVYNTVTTSPEDSSYFDRDTEGKREITLDTCTDDTQSRLLVLAREE